MITLEQMCKRSYYRQRHIDTPLLAERLQYLQYWADRNTPLNTLQSIAQYLLRIVEYLHIEKNSKVISLAQIEEAATRWAKLQYNHPQKRASFSKTGQKRFTWYALDWLKRMGCLEPLPEESIPLFNRLFERRKALLRHTTGPLLKERLKYLQYWADCGAAKSTL